MKVSDLLKPKFTSKITGAVFLAVGLYLFFLTPHSNAALGAAFIGILLLLIVNEDSVEKKIANAELESGVESMERLLDDLEVKGNGVLVPPGANLSESRVFVPAGRFDGLPDLYDEMTVVSEGGGRVGISLVPPGRSLLDEAKSRMEYEPGEGIEQARELMGMLTQGLGLAKSSSLREEDDKIKLRITHGSYDDLCESLRTRSENICKRAGCPICSAYLASAAEGMNEPLRIVDFEIEGRHIKYTLERIG